MRLISILVLLLLLISSIDVYGAATKDRRRRMKRRGTKKAPMKNEGVTPIGVGPYAPAYAGFFCSPAAAGVLGIMNKCNGYPVCKFKRIEDGAAGKVLTGELVEGQGDCMRRCDTRFGMSQEVHCGQGETCFSFVPGCPCPNLNDQECHPYED